jgi:DNA-binding NtrC family response regulator
MNSKVATILLVDDTPENLDVLIDQLYQANFNVSVALNGEKAIKLTKKIMPDIILMDIQMPPGIDGFETCRRLKQQEWLKDVPVIFMTILAESVDKLKGFAVGGVDYITKPFQPEEVLARIRLHLTLRQQQQALAQQNAELIKVNKQLKQEISRREQAEQTVQVLDTKLSLISQQEAKQWGLSAFIGKSQAIRTIIDEIHRLQKLKKTNVLILGESGTGKELIARAIHFGGMRAKGPFIAVNCSAIPNELVESAFFGHVQGAFTGANRDRKGYFEQADGGTLFLDEMGEMPLLWQTKLLRTIEDGLLTPVGSSKSRIVDVRILAATNADLMRKKANGTFREDLYYRLNGYTITVPPLRERKEDIKPLVAHFLEQFTQEMGQKQTVLTSPTLAILENYHFPGNVRELKNIVEHALIRSGGSPIQPHHLSVLEPKPTLSVSQITMPTQPTTGIAPINDEEKILIYVHRHGKINNSQCRELLGSDLHQAHYKLKKMTEKGLLIRKGTGRWTSYRQS